MAELFIQCPGQPDITIPLGAKAVTIGRAEDAGAFIAEKKASRQHLKVRTLEGGGAVAEDQGSSNGTWFVEPAGDDQRFLRRALRDDHRIEASITPFNGRLWVRLSAFLYNELSDYERLADAVLAITGGAPLAANA